jgi:sec-independent protein translocase protein TatC
MSDGDPKKDPAPPPKGRAEDDGMTIWEHLEELRSRMVKMLLAFVVGSIAAWSQKELLLQVLTKPFVDAWNYGSHSSGAALNFPAPTSLFIAYIRLSALAGLVVAMPFLLWQVWAFVAPGLYSKEKRYAAPFVLTSCVLFAVGGYFGWRVASPMAFNFLLNLGPEQVGALEIRPTIMISEYIEFMTHTLLAFGIVTELPILVFFLSVAGLVTPRQLIGFFRYFLVIDFVIAAVITPPDALSQLLLAVPLAVLYLFSIGIAWIFGKKRVEPETSSQP